MGSAGECGGGPHHSAVGRRPRRRRASVRESRALHRTFEQLATSMIDSGGGWAFLDALHQLYQLSREVPLAGALRSHQSVDVLLDVMRAAETPDRPIGMDPEPATLEDAVTALDLIEHQLRPLFAPAAEADLCHATANGLAALTGMAARWARGTPFVMSEHGIYLRERYLSYTAGDYRHHVRNILLHFFRRLTWAGYQIADMILPGSEYNRRWEIENGAAPDRIRPIYNGVEPDQFPVAEVEPDVPTLSWVGRIDPLKDVETLLRAFSRGARLDSGRSATDLRAGPGWQRAVRRPLQSPPGRPRPRRGGHLRRTRRFGRRCLPRRPRGAPYQHLGRLPLQPAGGDGGRTGHGCDRCGRGQGGHRRRWHRRRPPRHRGHCRGGRPPSP